MVMEVLRFGCFFKALTRYGQEVEADRGVRCDADHESTPNAARPLARAFLLGALHISGVTEA
jgi:hypothetical protein